jgi:predicted DNA-binding protein (UPF0251 family)
MMWKNRKLVAIGAGAAVFAAALGVGLFALSGSAGSSHSPSTTAQGNSQSILSVLKDSLSPDAASPSPTTGKLNPTVEDFLQKLAARLGISESTLKSDLQQTSLDELQQLVKDGKLTQDQADKIQSAITNGTDYFPGLNGSFGGRGGPGGMGIFGRGGLQSILGKNQDALAKWLGISTATLQSDLKSGESLATIATAQGKTTADLKTFLTGELDSQLKAQVTAGKLTQAQSDTIRAGVVANLDALINAKLPQFGGGHGNRPAKPNGTPPGGSNNGKPQGGGGTSSTS